MRTHQHPMTNEVAGDKVVTASVSLLAMALSWLPQIEAVLRVAASLLSVIAGAVVVWPSVKKLFRKRKHK